MMLRLAHSGGLPLPFAVRLVIVLWVEVNSAKRVDKRQALSLSDVLAKSYSHGFLPGFVAANQARFFNQIVINV